MTALRIPDEFGIVTENARKRDVFSRFIERRIDAYFASASGQARIAREVDARLKREVDELIARKTRERVAEIENMELPSGPPIGEVLTLVAEVTGCSVPDVVGPRRSRNIAWPRFLAVHLLLAVRPDLSLPAIGHALGGRDHTSIMHARNKFIKLMDDDPVSRWLLDERVVALLANKPQVVRAAGRPFSKLTEEQAKAIRGSHKSESELAAEFGISKSHAGYVRRGLSWKQAA